VHIRLPEKTTGRLTATPGESQRSTNGMMLAVIHDSKQRTNHVG
jgi:hypothetical protein